MGEAHGKVNIIYLRNSSKEEILKNFSPKEDSAAQQQKEGPEVDIIKII